VDLIAFGADSSVKDMSGRTPRDYALVQKHANAALLLGAHMQTAAGRTAPAGSKAERATDDSDDKKDEL